jgi:hypothetical protein
MNNENNKRQNGIWFIAFGAMAIFALAALGVIWVVRDAVQQTVSPVQQITGNLGTSVAAILNPTPTIRPDPVTIVHNVRSLARLETIQYTVEKVITAETGQGPFGFLFGDRLILVAHGIVIAGIDLEKLQPGDLRIQNDILYVRLPDTEIFTVTLDNQKSYVYNRDTGALTHGDINLESAARRAAEDEIQKSVIEDGILKTARQNAESYLYRLLHDLGFQEIIFEDATPAPQ